MCYLHAVWFEYFDFQYVALDVIIQPCEKFVEQLVHVETPLRAKKNYHIKAIKIVSYIIVSMHTCFSAS